MGKESDASPTAQATNIDYEHRAKKTWVRARAPERRAHTRNAKKYKESEPSKASEIPSVCHEIARACETCL